MSMTTELQYSGLMRICQNETGRGMQYEKLHTSFGFMENGEMDEDEIAAVLKL